MKERNKRNIHTGAQMVNTAFEKGLSKKKTFRKIGAGIKCS